MTALDVEWLSSKVGQDVITEAAKYPDSLSATAKLRAAYPEINPELIRQAIAQATYRSKARMETPLHFLLTDEGLQQGTRPQVAKYRADLIAKNFGKINIVDLTCGLGFDSYFFIEAGHQVIAIERDLDISKIAKHNLPGITVHNVSADAFEIPNDIDLVFIDPARRDPDAPKSASGQAKRIMNPESWSPSWSFVQSLSRKHKVIAKVAPGISEEFIGDWDAYWISADGDLVETMLISGGTSKRISVLLQNDRVIEIEGGHSTRVSELGKYLVIPNAALIRASALDYLANELDAGLVNEHIAWLTTNSENTQNFKNPAAQVLQILEISKLNEKALAQLVASYSPGSLTIMTRGVSLDPEVLRKKLIKKPLKGGPELVIAIYRDDAGPVALICQRLTN